VFRNNNTNILPKGQAKQAFAGCEDFKKGLFRKSSRFELPFCSLIAYSSSLHLGFATKKLQDDNDPEPSRTKDQDVKPGSDNSAGPSRPKKKIVVISDEEDNANDSSSYVDSDADQGETPEENSGNIPTKDSASAEGKN
jgi:hypothetical protein